MDQTKPSTPGSSSQDLSGTTPSLKAMGGTASQLSPQIKVPTPPSIVNSSGTTAPPAPSAPPMSPPQPMAGRVGQAGVPGNLPTMRPSAMGSQGIPPGVPSVPPSVPSPTTGGPSAFKSSIRTMQDDLNALNKGQAPAGFKLEKQPVSAVPTPSAPATQGARTMPIPRPTAQIELGKMERSKTMPSSGFTPTPDRISTPSITDSKTTSPVVNIPGKGGFLGGGNLSGAFSGKLTLWAVIAGIVVLAFLIWFFVIRGPAIPEITYTPTPTSSSTPVPSTTPWIEGAFQSVHSATLAGGSDFFDRLGAIIDGETLSLIEPRLYKISDPQGMNRYSFSTFMASSYINVPTGINAFLNDQDFYTSFLLEEDGNNSYGLIVKIKDSVGLDNAIKQWETTLSQDLKDIFKIDLTKASSTNFLSNTYQGVLVRYKNFPDYFKTLDYAIIKSVGGEEFMVFTNSREHMYSIINALK